MIQAIQGALNRLCVAKNLRDGQYVCGIGRIVRLLDDDTSHPRHQKFIVAVSRRRILIAHNIDGWDRVGRLKTGDKVMFLGEYTDNEEGCFIHRTHPDPAGLRPCGYVRKAPDGAREFCRVVYDTGRKEYFAGRGRIDSRPRAPETDDWPATGYWLSTNSNVRHGENCANYRKTRGYPCTKRNGRACRKCLGR